MGKINQNEVPDKLVNAYWRALESNTFSGSLYNWVRVRHMLYRLGYAGDTEPMGLVRWLAEMKKLEDSSK